MNVNEQDLENNLLLSPQFILIVMIWECIAILSVPFNVFFQNWTRRGWRRIFFNKTKNDSSNCFVYGSKDASNSFCSHFRFHANLESDHFTCQNLQDETSSFPSFDIEEKFDERYFEKIRQTTAGDVNIWRVQDKWRYRSVKIIIERICFIEQSRIFLHHRSADRSSMNFDDSFRLELILDIDLSSLSLLTGRLSSMMLNIKWFLSQSTKRNDFVLDNSLKDSNDLNQMKGMLIDWRERKWSSLCSLSIRKSVRRISNSFIRSGEEL